jgi:hypothetical protein
MNYKLNSYLSILAITCAVAVPLLSATARELPVQAALTAPASYNYSYRQANVDTVSGNNWAIKNNGGTAFSTIPAYTQSYDGQYYDYVQTSPTTITTGLTVFHTFNNSSSSWSNIVSSIYRPNNSATAIGSNSSSGTTINKWYVKFDNQTNKDYIIYLDNSSTSTVGANRINYNDDVIVAFSYPQNVLQPVILYAYSFVEFTIVSSSLSLFFDAWYLQDLGVNGAYDAGYDDGEEAGYIDGLENSNFLITAIESLIGMMVNFTFILFSLEIFGVSILMIIGVLFGIVAITWILKTIRG